MRIRSRPKRGGDDLVGPAPTPAPRCVHSVPPLERDGSARLPGGMTLEHLVDAGEAMLMEMVKVARQTRR